MKQTRHSFATVAMSCGENPLWIAKVMGHKNTEMIIKVYSKYIENAGISYKILCFAKFRNFKPEKQNKKSLLKNKKPPTRG